MKGLIAFAVCIVSLLHVDGFSPYTALIPNGNRVPNPCAGGGIWPAVGHNALAGGGPRNAFGAAFRANNYNWNRALCQADSDGDGVTNGAELGDRLCRWTPGSNNPLNNPTGHPGICEPIGSAVCRGQGCGAGNQGRGYGDPSSQEKFGGNREDDDHEHHHDHDASEIHDFS